MRKKHTVVAGCAALLVILSMGVSCTARPGAGGAPAQDMAADIPLVTATVAPTMKPAPYITLAPVQKEAAQPVCVRIDPADSEETGDTVPAAPTPSPIVADPVPASTPMATAIPIPKQTTVPAPVLTQAPTPAPTLAPTPIPTARLTPVTQVTPVPTLAPTPIPTAPPTPVPVAMPQPAQEPPQSRTICNICGANITGNVPAHGDGHLLNGEDFSYRVE